MSNNSSTPKQGRPQQVDSQGADSAEISRALQVDFSQLPTGSWLLPLEELVASYSPVYPSGGNWSKTVDFLYKEEPEHMKELTAALCSQPWREPILLATVEDIEEGDRLYVLDGTHRVALALQEGLSHVPVTTTKQAAVQAADTGCLVLTLGLKSGEPLLEEEDEELFTTLRSFQLKEDCWVVSDMFSGDRSGWSAYYEPLPEDLWPLLEERVAQRLLKNFPEHRFSYSLEHETFDD